MTTAAALRQVRHRRSWSAPRRADHGGPPRKDVGADEVSAAGAVVDCWLDTHDGIAASPQGHEPVNAAAPPRLAPVGALMVAAAMTPWAYGFPPRSPAVWTRSASSGEPAG